MVVRVCGGVHEGLKFGLGLGLGLLGSGSGYTAPAQKGDRLGITGDLIRISGVHRMHLDRSTTVDPSRSTQPLPHESLSVPRGLHRAGICLRDDALLLSQPHGAVRRDVIEAPHGHSWDPTSLDCRARARIAAQHVVRPRPVGAETIRPLGWHAFSTRAGGDGGARSDLGRDLPSASRLVIEE